MQLVKRRKRWFLIYVLPRDVRAYFGKTKLSETLHTGDEAVAKIRAAMLEAKWRQQVAEARERLGRGEGGEARKFWEKRFAKAATQEERNALHIAMSVEAQVAPSVWRAAIAAAPPQDQADDADPIGDAAWEIARDASSRIAGREEMHPAAARAAQAYYDQASGRIIILAEHIRAYVASLDVTVKTRQQRTRLLEIFVAQFPTSADVQKRAVQRWIDAQQQAGYAPETIIKRVQSASLFWRWLIDRAEVLVAPAGPDPFAGLALPKKTHDRREAWSREEAVVLLGAAVKRGDRRLAAAVALASCSGARIEELCSIKVEDAEETHFHIREGKTRAAERTVPVHPLIAPVIRMLKATSTDGFLLSGYRENARGERSVALSQQFSTLKTELGFGQTHNFHSFRRTVATQLDDAGVPKQHAARILGHAEKGMTFGLYSAGARLETLREALVRAVDYPGMAKLIKEITQ